MVQYIGFYVHHRSYQLCPPLIMAFHNQIRWVNIGAYLIFRSVVGCDHYQVPGMYCYSKHPRGRSCSPTLCRSFLGLVSTICCHGFDSGGEHACARLVLQGSIEPETYSPWVLRNIPPFKRGRVLEGFVSVDEFFALFFVTQQTDTLYLALVSGGV